MPYLSAIRVSEGAARKFLAGGRGLALAHLAEGQTEKRRPGDCLTSSVGVVPERFRLSVVENRCEDGAEKLVWRD